MAVYFLDSSAIVKRYCRESASGWVQGIAAPDAGNDVFIVRVAAVEVISALVRRMRMREIDASDAHYAISLLKSDLRDEYQIVEVTEELIVRAMELSERHGLRGYDAIQLGAACEISRVCVENRIGPAVLVCADVDLNAAAGAEGLAVENPNDHPDLTP